MSHWNHRMTVDHKQTPSGYKYDLYAVREIYYDDDGNLQGWTDPVHLDGETPYDVMWDVHKIREVVRGEKILDLSTKEWVDWPPKDEEDEDIFDEQQVCVTHLRFVPCRSDGGHHYSSKPDEVEMVRKHQQGG